MKNCKTKRVINNDDIEEAVEFLRDLDSEWEWKRNSTPKNNREMARLGALIGWLEHIIDSPAYDMGETTKKEVAG